MLTWLGMPDPIARDATTTAILRKLAVTARNELLENILPFWLALEDPAGGHWISVDRQNRIDRTAPRRLVFAARILWTLSEAARRLRNEKLASAAERAHAYLLRFHDAETGGYVAALASDGTPFDRSKHVYGQAFTIFGLAAFGRMARQPGPIQAALDLFEIIEARARQTATGLYVESFDSDWRETPNADRALGEEIAPHTADTHLHLIEAYAQLLAASRTERLAATLETLVEVFIRRFLDSSGSFAHQKLSLSGDPMRSAIWPGHDIEASTIIDQAADLLGDPPPDAPVRQISRCLAFGALRNGRQAGGGWTERVRDGVADPWRLWWVQAEAALGLLNCGLRMGDAQMIERAAETWDFIVRHQRDPRGDWHLRVSATGVPDPTAPRVTFWKEPYHQARACMETVRRCAAAVDQI